MSMPSFQQVERALVSVMSRLKRWRLISRKHWMDSVNCFDSLSYTEDVGSKAFLSRAAAGVIKEKVLFALPGSVKAVELAMDKLIFPEIHHIVHELTKHLED